MSPNLCGAQSTSVSETRQGLHDHRQATQDVRVGQHPWILTRENQVDLTCPQLDMSPVNAALQARQELDDAANSVLALLLDLGRGDNPPELYKPARKAARLVRRVTSSPSQTNIDERVAGAIDAVHNVPGAGTQEFAELIGEWGEAVRRCSNAWAALADTLEAHLITERTHIAATLAHPSLRLAAPLSSLTMAGSAARYTAEINAGEALGSHSRKSEPRLVRLVQRALHRVSPYSHYTAVGLGWDQGDPTAIDLPLATHHASPPQSTVQADLASLGRLVRSQLEMLGEHTPLVVSPYRLMPDKTVVFTIAVDDPIGQSRILDGTVRTVTIRHSEGIEALLAATAAGPVTLAALRESVGRDDASREAVTRLCTRLRDLGVLQPWNPVVPGERDVVVSTTERLAQLAGAWDTEAFDELIHHLNSITAAQQELAASNPDTRTTAVQKLSSAWASAGSTSTRPAYEDVTYPDVLAVPPRALETLRRDLADLAQVTDVFDNTHLGHGLLHLGLLERTGGRTELSFDEFATLVPPILADSNMDREAMMQRLSSHDPSVNSLLNARAQAAHQLVEAAERGDEEVVWEPEQLRAWRAAIDPALRRRRTSAAWFLQATQVTDGIVERAVINAVHDGDAQMFSRFLQSWDPAFIQRLRDRLGVDLAEDHVEVAPVHGFNANVHPWLLPRAFRSDGVDESRWPEVVEPDALRVVIGEHTIRAVDRNGRTLHPHYFGFLVPFLLPPVAAALYMLGRGPLIRMDLGTDVEREAGPEDIIVHPRVRYGSIVVTRRAVSLPATEFPLQTADESIADFLIRMELFRQRHDLPAHVFLRAEPKVDAMWQQFVAMRTKPLPVDLTSPLHLRLLPNWLANAHRVRITEALPDTHGRPRLPWGLHSCSEFVLETVCRAQDRS